MQQFLYEITPQEPKPGHEDMNTRRLHTLVSYINKHYTGLSPMVFVNHRLIEAAKEMLAESPSSISEIAAMAGFRDSL